VKAMGHDPDAGFERMVEREFSRPTGVAADACPQVELLAAWFDRALVGDGAEAVQVHLAACGRCQELLATIARTEPEVLYVNAPAEPATRRFWTWHLRWAVPLAAAAVVVIAVAVRPPSLQAPAAAPPAPVPSDTVLAREVEAPSVSAAGASPGQSAAPGKPAAKEVAGGGAVADRAFSPGRRDAAKTEGFAASPAGEPAAAPVPPPAAGGAVAALPAAPPPAPLQERVEEKADVSRDNRMAAPIPVREGAAMARQRTAAAESRFAGAAAVGAAVLPPVFAPGGQTGWRVEGPGFVARTDDGGATWTVQRVPGGVRIHTLVPVSPVVCWGAGPSGALVRTLDGTTWQVVSPPVATDLAALTATSDLHASVRAADGTTYETTDGGASWRRR
jgi:hypothetical protein